MAWRLAGSLVVLRNQINAMAPHRSKASDGAIGDQQHRVRCSRHNPDDHGVVTALDITHDPWNGVDIHAIADRIRRNPHPELAYIISLGRIAGRSTGWAWHAYKGSNKHNVHAHFGVGQGSDCDPRPPYDSSQLWSITPAPAPPALQEDDMTPEQDARLRNIEAVLTNQKRDELIVEAALTRVLTTRGHPVRKAIRELAQLGANDAEADDAPPAPPV